MKNTKQTEQDAFTLPSGERVLIPCKCEKPKPVECDMCGAENEADAELCKMCSNYLKRS